MEPVIKPFIRVREFVVRSVHGQTMTEYALLLASIAVVVFGITVRWATTSVHLPRVSIPL